MNMTLDRSAPWAASGLDLSFLATDAPRVVSFPTAGESTLEPCGIGVESIVAGTPHARASTQAQSPDGHFATGMWDCTAGVLDIQFGCDELVHILAGEVVVHNGNAVHRLLPGHVAYFPRGTAARWEIPQYVKKVYVHRYPQRAGLLRRALRRLARWLRAGG